MNIKFKNITNTLEKKVETMIVTSEPTDELIHIIERFQNIVLKDHYALKAFQVTKYWVVFLCIVTVLQFVLPICHFGSKLSDWQFSVLLGSVSLAIFGFWLTVGKSLFPQNK